MSDNPPQITALTPRPGPTPDQPTLSFSGIIHAEIGATVTVLPSWITYIYGSRGGDGTYLGPGAPITDANVLFTVVTPSAFGTLMLDSVLTSQFTYQDIVDGRVTFHHDGSPDADNISMFAEITEVPSVVKPYTPHFWNDYIPPSGTTKGAFYIGLTLIGASGSMPALDEANYGTSSPGSTRGIITRSFFTSVPNEVTLLLAWSLASSTTTSYPAPIPIASLTCPGLTIIRLGGGSFNVIIEESVHGTIYHNTISTELFYTTTTSVFSAATMTATFTATGSSGPEQCFLSVLSYSNIADLSNPWGTDPASVQMYATNTLPGSLSLNTLADDKSVLPVLFESISGSEDSEVIPPFTPKGYSSLGGGGVFGGAAGSSHIEPMQRTGFATSFIGTDVVAPTGETLTDSELLFQPQHGFVDLSAAATRQLFVSLSGTPQWMGVSGEIPFAQQPAVYLTTLGPALNFPQNNGNGGAFVVSGEIDPAAGPGCTPHVITEATGPAQRPQWRLTVSDDGARTWSTLVKPRDIGALGHYKTRLRWLKMGQFRQRVIKLECTDPVRRNVIGIYIDIDQGMAS